MNNKPRFPSKKFMLLRFLNTRMKLPDNVAKYYYNLKKGFEGEQEFDKLLENNSKNCLVLNDLLLELYNSEFQIDTLLFSKETIYLIDVKNYEGDYYIEEDRWYQINKFEIKNPILQLKRCESLLRRFIQDYQYHFSIESKIIFINPNFTLYQSPLNLPIIFPSQLQRFINKLSTSSSTPNDKHFKFAQQLLSYQVSEKPYTNLPNYSFDQLKKGPLCIKCLSFYHDHIEGALVCHTCGCKTDVETIVLQSVEEYKLLFPDRAITTNAIYEWCKLIISKKTIRRILTKHFELKGHGRTSHFVSPKK